MANLFRNNHTLILFVYVSLNLVLEANGLTPLSSAEADSIIAQREVANAALEADRVAELEDVEMLSVVEYSLPASRRAVFRRVAAPAELPVSEMATNTTAPQSLDFSRFPQPTEEHVDIQLHATVYDGAFSKLILTLEKTRYTIWTNLNFNYLQLIGSFTTEDRHYSYFGITDQINHEREALNAQFAKEKGFSYTSRWEAPPVRFTEAPEYVLVTEDARGVPEEVYRQLDDLTGYYLANKERLEVEFRNARELQAARERYKNTHPEEPQDIVLNYSRMSAPAE